MTDIKPKKKWIPREQFLREVKERAKYKYVLSNTTDSVILQTRT